jgi:hypothetical protein
MLISQKYFESADADELGLEIDAEVACAGVEPQDCAIRPAAEAGWVGSRPIACTCGNKLQNRRPHSSLTCCLQGRCKAWRFGNGTASCLIRWDGLNRAKSHLTSTEQEFCDRGTHADHFQLERKVGGTGRKWPLKTSHLNVAHRFQISPIIDGGCQNLTHTTMIAHIMDDSDAVNGDLCPGGLGDGQYRTQHQLSGTASRDE